MMMMMKVRTVRQVKQQRPRYKRQAATGIIRSNEDSEYSRGSCDEELKNLRVFRHEPVGGNVGRVDTKFAIVSIVFRCCSCVPFNFIIKIHTNPIKLMFVLVFAGGNESSASSGVYKPVPPPKPVSPPYRMPPLPPGASSLYGEPSIPGAATASEAPLRTHSAKYPVSVLYVCVCVFVCSVARHLLRVVLWLCERHVTTYFTLYKCKCLPAANRCCCLRSITHVTTIYAHRQYTKDPEALLQFKIGIINCVNVHTVRYL